ncbi:MAG: apolipoprotein N-acyltransferase [Ignavibacteria bacterium]
MKFNKRNFYSIVIAGLLYGLSFPPVNLFFMIFFALVILLEIVERCLVLKQVVIRTYLTFFIAGLIGISWISLSGIRDGADPFLIIGGLLIMLIYPIFFVLPMILFFYIKKNLREINVILSLISFPFLWAGFEYISSASQISFPWLLAGNSQSYNLSKIQFSEITGVFGISFWISLISALIWLIFYKVKTRSWRITSLKSAIIAIIIIFVFFLPDIYTSLNNLQSKFSDYKKEGEIKVGVLQPNIDPWKKWGGKQVDLINNYVESIKKVHFENPDLNLIVLPETALPYYFREGAFEVNYKILKNLCDSLNIPFMIGTPDLQIYSDQQNAPNDAKRMKSSGLKYDTYNSAFLFEPGKDKTEYQKHYKVKLVIGSERMPYQEVFPFTKSLVEWGVGLGAWQIGNDTNIFTINPEQKFNTAICYESVYPEFFADFVNRGAHFSVIITNDGWWGKFFGTYQHNQFAIFRAVENRRWIARCANTGISCFIDPYGNMYKETDINVKAQIVHNIGLSEEKTFYTRHGDLFAKICLYSGLIFFGLSFLLRKSKF